MHLITLLDIIIDDFQFTDQTYQGSYRSARQNLLGIERAVSN